MRTLTAEQTALVSERETMPIYLVDLNEERLSTNGDRVLDDVTYIGGDVGVSSLNNWTEARISLRPTPARLTQIMSGGWRNQPCIISLYPAVQYRQLIEEGYYAEGTAIDGFHSSDPIVLLDGVLTAAQLGNRVELTVTHRSAIARWVPPIRITAPVCNHLPKPGTVFVWQGDNYTLEAR